MCVYRTDRATLNGLVPVRIVLSLALLLLNACQSLPGFHPDTNLGTISKHRFPVHKDQFMVGRLAEVETEDRDSLAVIGRYFGLGFDEISRANPELDPWIPEPGSQVLLPLQFILPDAPRQGVVLNLAAKRLFYFPKSAPDTVFTYPVGIGREGWETPLGVTRIVAKRAHPVWTVPLSVRREHARKGDPLPRVVSAGPDNPLGEYAMRLGIAGYLIHGTNKPYGVGMEVSHGCIRLYPEDISRFFKQTPTGTRVRLVDQPYLTAWEGDRLFLQAYSPVHKSEKEIRRLVAELMARLKRIERKSQRPIDWRKVETVLAHSEGVPTPIFVGSGEAPVLLRAAHPSELYRDTIPVPLSIDAWSLKVASFESENKARRLAAMLNHQGPPIPAHVHEMENVYVVMAGPFALAREAKSAAKRLRLDFEIESELVMPGEADTVASDEDGLLARFRAWLE